MVEYAELCGVVVAAGVLVGLVWRAQGFCMTVRVVPCAIFITIVTICLVPIYLHMSIRVGLSISHQYRNTMTLWYPSNLIAPGNPSQPPVVLFNHNLKILTLVVHRDHTCPVEKLRYGNPSTRSGFPANAAILQARN